MRKSAYRSYSLNLPESGESSPHQRMCSKQNYLGRIIPSLGALSGLSHLTTHLSLGFQLRQIRRVILLTQHTAQVLRHGIALVGVEGIRSEEHTSELQSRGHLVCRLLLAKKNLHCIRTIP